MVLLDFLVVTGTPILGIASILFSRGIFGLLLKTVVTLHGGGICFTIALESPGTPSVSLTASLFVA